MSNPAVIPHGWSVIGEATVNLNAVAQTTIFIIPPTVNGCIIWLMIYSELSGANTRTWRASAGASGTPTDWQGNLASNFQANQFMWDNGQSGAATPTYGPGTIFVVDVTVPEGNPLTMKVRAIGLYI